MALLCSSPQIDVYHRFHRDPKRFPVHDADGTLARRHNRRILELDADGLADFQKLTSLYNELSHAGLLSVASQFMFGRPGYLAIGGEFDTEKTAVYRIEIERRVGAAKLLASITNHLAELVERPAFYEKGEHPDDQIA